ncbi:hypothetical protein BGZ54_003925 [Gamsiella multidivaricata]|nr:hypothetical protein BGZ54_003925 [Gamsiella multidivaricata]
MPSITLSNPEDKATVKRFLSSPNTRIITATVARLYVAYPDPLRWTYTGIMGAVALIQTNNTFFLRIVDLLYGRGVVWEQELYDGFIYSQDKPFFHSFHAEKYIAGFSFADELEADVFYGKVHRRALLRPWALVRSGKAGGAQGRGRIPLHNGKLDKSRIGLPSDFRHVGHIGWDPDVGFDAQNIDPAWRELFEQLDTCGVSRQQINENATFITEFISAHGGLPKNASKQKKPDLSRIDSPPPLRPQSPQQQQKRPPPPPPPPGHNNVASLPSPTASMASPVPFHGYLPRPLAQVMASLSFGSSSYYGTSNANSQSPPSPRASEALINSTLSPANNAPAEISAAAVPPAPSTAPPPPPPPPPPMINATAKDTRSPLAISGSIQTASHAKNKAYNNINNINNINKDNNNTGNVVKSPVESSLLASIRESGGLQGLRKTGALRSPRPIPARPLSPLGGPSSSSQGDLVSALVAALQRRQTRLTYSDDEGQAPSEDDDSWDADE